MKLISCHIENFGKISGRDLSFGGGLTAFCEENGYGKTTLAAFLKAMFYGMEPSRRNGRFNDRTHYYPFDGGRFGGNVVFLCKGKEYRIERFFDETSDTRDELTVYRDGRPCDLGGEPGEVLFGIDRESFERTAFITGKETEIGSTDSINTRLNNFVEGSDDDTNLRAALERIDKRSKEYRKRGGGLIAEEGERIVRLHSELKNYETVRAGLPGKYVRLNEKNRQIHGLAAEIAAAQTRNVAFANWERYDGLCASAAEHTKKIAALEEKYPFGVPSAEEAEKAFADAGRLEELRAVSEKRTFTAQDEARLEALGRKFSGGVPETEELSSAQESIVRMNGLDAALAPQDGGLSEEEEKLRRRFAARFPDAAEAEEAEKQAERFKKADAACAAAEETTVTVREVSFKANIAAAAVGALLLLAGIGVLFVQQIAGIVLAALGALLLLADAFLYLNKKSGSAVRTENPERAAARRERESAERELAAILLPYGYSLGEGVLFAAAKFREDRQRYLAAEKKAEERARGIRERQAERAEVQRSLDTFFAKYGTAEGDPVSRLAALRAEIAEYRSLLGRKKASEEAERGTAERAEELERALLAFCGKYRVPPEGLRGRARLICDDVKELAAERAERRRLEEEARVLREEKHLAERPAGTAADLKEMNAKLAELAEEKNRLSLEIAADETDAERAGELQNELEESEERLRVYKKNHALLERTAALLKEADGRLKDKYVRPIRERFSYYSGIIERALGEKIYMDAEFNLRFEHGGQQRSEEHLSTGQRTVCAFCFRMALIDNMYAEEKPFLILDDPFTGLDGAHFAKVKEVLASLSEKMQLIYFTCHESRMP